MIMTWLRDSIFKLLVGVAYRIRTSAVGETLHQSPIGNSLKRLYRKSVDVIRNDRYDLTIEDVTATFHAEDPQSSRKLVHLKRSESLILTDFVSTLDENDIVYDLGAHLGLYSCFAAQVVEDGAVVAFEPFPPTVAELRRNLQLNGDARIVEAAVSHTNCRCELHFDSNETGNPKPRLKDTTGGQFQEMVQTMTLDRYVAEEGPTPTILKIDVEGEEKNVLEGGERTLSSPELRAVYCEIHSEENKSEIVEYFSNAGFNTQELESSRDECFLKAHR